MTVTVVLSQSIPTNATDNYLFTSISGWSIGYYRNDGSYTSEGYLDNGRVTSPNVGVTPGTHYYWRIGASNSPTMLINEFDNSGFLRRVAVLNQLAGTYTPGDDVVYVSFTVATFDNPDYSVSIYYNPDDLSIPSGTPQIYPDVHYGSDGDFVASGNEKHLMFYKYFPNDNDYVGITVYAVNNYGERLKYRIVGYVHGNIVFRSGITDYGETVNIDGKNFDYYDVYLLNWAEYVNDGEWINVGYVESFKYVYSVRYYQPDPTQPPGIVEELTPTDYVNLEDYDGVQPPTVPDLSGVQSPIYAIVPYTIGSLVVTYQFFVPAIGLTFIIWLLYDRRRGGGS